MSKLTRLSDDEFMDVAAKMLPGITEKMMDLLEDELFSRENRQLEYRFYNLVSEISLKENSPTLQRMRESPVFGERERTFTEESAHP